MKVEVIKHPTDKNVCTVFVDGHNLATVERSILDPDVDSDAYGFFDQALFDSIPLQSYIVELLVTSYEQGKATLENYEIMKRIEAKLDKLMEERKDGQAGSDPVPTLPGSDAKRETDGTAKGGRPA